MNGTIHIECGLNNLDFPDHKSKNWSPFWHNRRPNHPGHTADTLINYSFKTLCAGKYYTLDQSVREYQGDSVAYSFYWPQYNNGTKASYINGYSFTYPLPFINATKLIINPLTGIIPVTPGSPTGSGSYILGIQAEEFRKDTIVSGNKTQIMSKRIGYVRHELFIWIDDTSTCREDSLHPKDISLTEVNDDSTLTVYFHSGISGEPNSQVRCNSISADGTEFYLVDSSRQTGPNAYYTIPATASSWNCHGGVTDRVKVKFTESIGCGDYYLFLKVGTDLDVLESECGFWEGAGRSAKVLIDKNISVDLGPDTSVCSDRPFQITLDAGPGPYRYFWSTWDTSRTLNVTFPTTYWVDVFNAFNCVKRDSIIIHKHYCAPVNSGGGSGSGGGGGTGINSSQQDAFSLYPNPGSEVFFVQTPASTKNADISVFDILGSQVYQKRFVNVNSQLRLDLTGFRSGVYFFILKDQRGIVFQERLVVKDQ